MLTEEFYMYRNARRRAVSMLADPLDTAFKAADRVIETQAEQIKALESLRPHWAQGFTSDGQAAQAQTAALSDVWDALGVDNQTAAMQRLRRLLDDEADNPELIPAHDPASTLYVETSHAEVMARVQPYIDGTPRPIREARAPREFVTAEMLAAWVAYEPPADAEPPRSNRAIGLIKAAFYAGWLARERR